jgi:1-acyl-sn-glycerol-3-phosphate acyltransferase
MVTPLFIIADLAVTFLLWVYFIFGFVLISVPYLGWLSIRKKPDESDYQNLFHLFFRIFFRLVLFFAPRLTLKIDPKLRSIRSAVIVSNHQSYLDPLLLISIFKKHKTIVKNSFFNVPVFGWLMKKSGYVPSSANGKHLALVVRQIGTMKEFLTGGGILFVFPEGTRSRNGNLNLFNKGAFSIAKQCQAAICVIQINGTNRLFKPGSGLFKTCLPITVELKVLGVIEPSDPILTGSADEIAETAKQMIQQEVSLDQKVNSW